ncbi:MAG TPA: hypothetical protein DCP98_05150 [Sphaerochaeta sp.]|nr:hypothetical protein [Sphaerochaeta sp.]
MKGKSFAIFLLFMSFLLAFSSCSNEVTIGREGTLVVNFGGSESRGILPTISMVTASYTITIKDSAGTNVIDPTTIGSNATSATFRLPAGNYTVNVDAKNTDGTVIGGGSQSVSVTAGGENSVTVNISECEGDGVFAISIQANSGYSLKLNIYNNLNEVKYSKDLIYSEGSYITDSTVSLSNGFYRFEIVRSDTGKAIKNDSVRVVKGVTSTYSATFTFASDGSVTIVNEMINIPAIEITLQKETFSVTETLTATASISGISDFTSCWYMDGVAIGSYSDYSDLSYSLENCEAGDHEIALFVKNSQVMWSESVSFSVENQAFYMLGFTNLTTGDGSRGMTKFPDGVPFLEMDTGIEGYGLWLSCNAMSALPVIPSFKKVVSNPANYIKSVLTNDFSGYGFPMKIVKYKVNPDGLFLRYVLYEDEKTIGMIDYYYSWLNQTFSYREIVTPFLQNTSELGDNILYFQMYNVPIYEDLDGVHFSAGLNSDGTLNSDTDLQLTKVQSNGTGWESYADYSFNIRVYDLIMDMDGGEVNATGYHGSDSYADVSDYSGMETFLLDEEVIDKYEVSYNSETKRIVVNDDKCNLDYAYDMLSFLCSSSIDDYKAADDICCIEDFNDLRLELNSTSRQNATDDNDLSFCTKYDFDKKIAATLGPDRERLTYCTEEFGLALSDALKSFCLVYPEIYGSEVTTSRDFARKHLMECGLSESTVNAMLENYTWVDDN